MRVHLPVWFACALILVAAPAMASPPICTDVLNAANGSRLEQFIPPAAGKPAYVDELISRLDIDGDGVPRFLGTMHDPATRAPYTVISSTEGYLWLFDQQHDPASLERITTVDLGDSYGVGRAVGILPAYGNEYLVFADGNRLSYVARIDAGLTETLVCRFEQHTPPKRIVLDGDAPVCAAVRDGHVRDVYFPRDRFSHDYDVNAGPNVAHVDVDNDGVVDDIVMGGEVSREYGCGYDQLRPFGPARTEQQMRLRDLLARVKSACGGIIQIVEYDRRTYLDAIVEKRVTEPHEVYEISGGEVHTVCTLDAAWKNVIVEP